MTIWLRRCLGGAQRLGSRRSSWPRCWLAPKSILCCWQARRSHRTAPPPTSAAAWPRVAAWPRAVPVRATIPAPVDASSPLSCLSGGAPAESTAWLGRARAGRMIRLACYAHHSTHPVLGLRSSRVSEAAASGCLPSLPASRAQHPPGAAAGLRGQGHVWQPRACRGGGLRRKARRRQRIRPDGSRDCAGAKPRPRSLHCVAPARFPCTSLSLPYCWLPAAGLLTAPPPTAAWRPLGRHDCRLCGHAVMWPDPRVRSSKLGLASGRMGPFAPVQIFGPDGALCGRGVRQRAHRGAARSRCGARRYARGRGQASSRAGEQTGSQANRAHSKHVIAGHAVTPISLWCGLGPGQEWILYPEVVAALCDNRILWRPPPSPPSPPPLRNLLPPSLRRCASGMPAAACRWQATGQRLVAVSEVARRVPLAGWMGRAAAAPSWSPPLLHRRAATTTTAAQWAVREAALWAVTKRRPRRSGPQRQRA